MFGLPPIFAGFWSAALASSIARPAMAAAPAAIAATSVARRFSSRGRVGVLTSWLRLCVALVLCERATAVKSASTLSAWRAARQDRRLALISGGRAQRPLELDRQRDSQVDESEQQRLRQVELEAVRLVDLQQAFDGSALLGELAPEASRALHLQ